MKGASALSAKRTSGGEHDSIGQYLSDIGQYPLLTKNDEAELAKRIEAGVQAAAELSSSAKLTVARKRQLAATVRRGQDAQQTFIQSNLRLVVSIAKKYQASGLPLLNLVQEGNLGLIHAVGKFDHTKGFKFSTYATWWIRQAITRGIANTGRTIRLPVHTIDAVRNVTAAQIRLENELGRTPTLEELAGETQLAEDKLVELLLNQSDAGSLSTPLGSDGDLELGDILADHAATTPFDAVANTVLPAEVAAMLKPLNERERDVLRLRFGLDRGESRTLEEVGEICDLTRERIRQIEMRAMSKLRHPAADSGARELLG